MKTKEQKFNIADFHNKKEDQTFLEVGNGSSYPILTVTPDFSSMSNPYSMFDDICLKYSKEKDNEFDRVASSNEGEQIVELERFAMFGKIETVTTLIENIQTFLNKHKFMQVDIPDYYKDIHLYAPEEQRKYSNLAHAIFHELFGLNALACWNKYQNSYAAQVIGTSIWIYDPKVGKDVRMPYSFKSTEEVEKLLRAFASQKETGRLNDYSTSLELDLYTGERVSIMIKPNVRQTVITMRKHLIGKVIPEDFAAPEKKTIPVESIPIWYALSLTMSNTAFVGPMGTGKSSWVKAMIGVRDLYIPHVTGAGIEKEYELGVSIHFPGMKFIEIIEKDFDRAIERLLRSDAVWAIIGEIRLIEAEGAMLLCERLLKGFLTSYHTWKPDSIPSQWASLICKTIPGAVKKDEERRVAENLDFSVVLTQDENKMNKRVKSIQETRYNRLNGEISTHQIMRWVKETDTWQYRFDVSDKLLSEMKDINPEWANIFVNTLQELEAKSPIPQGEGVTIYNPAVADPNYRMALALEELTKTIKDFVASR